MPNTDGIIRSREPITLKKSAARFVEQAYGTQLIQQTVVERISYLSDELTVRGCIARPSADGVYPILIWNRGGLGDKGALTDLSAHLVLASTAVWGYVVLATHYRGNRGGEGIEDWGGADLTDALNMIEVAKNIPQADPDRIAIEGASRGGMTTYRALVAHDGFKCAIVHAGITDLDRLAATRPDFQKLLDIQFDRMSATERQEKIQSNSAVHFAERFPKNCPLLIMHGDRDTVVPLEQSQVLAQKLREHDIPHRFEIIKGGTHVALKDGSYREIDRLRRDWLKKYLNPA